MKKEEKTNFNLVVAHSSIEFVRKLTVSYKKNLIFKL